MHAVRAVLLPGFEVSDGMGFIRLECMGFCWVLATGEVSCVNCLCSRGTAPTQMG
jgi:hypothetical protein